MVERESTIDILARVNKMIEPDELTQLSLKTLAGKIDVSVDSLLSFDFNQTRCLSVPGGILRDGTIVRFRDPRANRAYIKGLCEGRIPSVGCKCKVDCPILQKAKDFARVL